SAEQATRITRSGDAVVLSAAATAVVGIKEARSADSALHSLLETASRLGVWDGVVCAVRAFPTLLGRMVVIPRYQEELRDVLIRSRDEQLAKSVGIITRSTGVRGVLTPRELEIMEQVRQGKTSAEIAASLFITVATVKRHLAATYRKLGAKNRAEAIARY